MNPVDIWQRTTRTPNGCLEWIGSRARAGYGTVNVGGYRYDTAHRIAYELTYGPIPPKGVVMHTCDNPPCIEPTHLRLGDHRTNSLDMFAKGRARPGKPLRGADWRGPRFDANQVLTIRSEYAAGGVTYAQLAARYDVAVVTIARLCRGSSYTSGSGYCRPDGQPKKARA